MKPSQGDDFSGAGLDEILKHLESLLQASVGNRHMMFHTPVLMTLALDGRPRGRTVVLRAFDPSQRILRCHADIRSEKVAEIGHDPRVGWNFYDPLLKWQARLQGIVTVHHQDDIARQAWQTSRRMSQVCYGTDPAPGTVIAGGDRFDLPQTPEQIGAGEAHFAVLVCRYTEIEALWLGHRGHLRMRYSWPDETNTLLAEWLAP